MGLVLVLVSVPGVAFVSIGKYRTNTISATHACILVLYEYKFLAIHPSKEGDSLRS